MSDYRTVLSITEKLNLANKQILTASEFSILSTEKLKNLQGLLLYDEDCAMPQEYFSGFIYALTRSTQLQAVTFDSRIFDNLFSKQLKLLFQILSSLPNLKHLEFRNCLDVLDNTTFPYFLNLLRNCNLQTLYFSFHGEDDRAGDNIDCFSVDIRSELVNEFGTVLSSLRNLNNLRLDLCVVYRMELCQKFFQDLHRLQNLRSLEFVDASFLCGDDDEISNVGTLITCLESSLRQMNNLRRFNWYFTDFTNYSHDQVLGLSIKTLSIKVLDMIGQIRNLEDLTIYGDLSHVIPEHEECFRCFTCMLAGLTRLHILNIAGCKFSQLIPTEFSIFGEIISNLPKLRELIIDSNCPDELRQALAKATDTRKREVHDVMYRDSAFIRGFYLHCKTGECLSEITDIIVGDILFATGDYARISYDSMLRQLELTKNPLNIRTCL